MLRKILSLGFHLQWPFKNIQRVVTMQIYANHVYVCDTVSCVCVALFVCGPSSEPITLLDHCDVTEWIASSLCIKGGGCQGMLALFNRIQQNKNQQDFEKTLGSFNDFINDDHLRKVRKYSFIIFFAEVFYRDCLNSAFRNYGNVL